MRLIDADALKDSFCEACSTKKRYKRTNAECRTHSNALYGYSCFKMRLIDTAPTIDAEPVRHGRWIEVDRITWRIGDGDMFDTTVEEKCSNCGRHMERYETEKQENYCPNCGAKMTEVQDGT